MDKTLRVCKICHRKFANGKAMGGHMRSHFAKLPIPQKLSVQPSSSSTITPPPNNLHPPPSALVLSYAEVEPSSETESDKNPKRRRSKRARKTLNMVRWTANSIRPIVFEDAETLSAEEAARCLLSLSRDKQTRLREPYEYSERIDVDVDMSVENDNDEDDDFCVTNSHVRAHPKYKCEACNKVFRSHQALGGHRASHKNKEILRALTEEGEVAAAAEKREDNGGGYQEEIIHPRTFKCPFCDKVLQSGQALGGHKKIHFTYLAAGDKVVIPETSSSSNSKSVVRLFDLNLPAPEDES